VLRFMTSRPRRRAPRLPEGLRVYAVGDVHGRADLLLRLFTAIDADLARRVPAPTLEIFLGDYIDRGPCSRQVVDILLARGRAHKLVLLKGNHETYPAQFLADPDSLAEWRPLGGLETLASYGLASSLNPDHVERRELAARFAAALPQSHDRFFAGLQTSFCCGDFFFVHAGVRPGVPLDRQREDDMLWIREDFLLHERDFGKIVVHGHTPVRDPDFRNNRINIDTGAFATGRLTCLVLEGEEVGLLPAVTR
jgi:serine/threonine protein phosphatase 1